MHGSNHHLVYLELEVNQGLLSSADAARGVAARLASALSRLRVREAARPPAI
jgi:hypothetical protein